MGPVRDEGSLEEWQQAILGRSRRGLGYWRARADNLALDSPPTAEQATLAIRTWRAIAFLEMYEGRFAEAKSWLERGLALSRTSGVSAEDRAYLRALLGIAALRRGEIENCLDCLGPSSCIFPIVREAFHTKQAGSREAVQQFTAYLEEWPDDLRIRWLLNIAYMTLGEYPEKVPPAYLITLDRFRSKIEVGRFENVAPRVGLGVRGPGLAGGSICDDFNGDGLPDLLTTSVAADQGASLFVNRGDGTFENRSTAAGLDTQVYALNLTRADYDNDGKLDVLLLRGGWEKPARLSLLRNKGGGVFEDVTIASGLGEPIASESAAWGDYDNDGLVDVFVCGEYAEDSSGGPAGRPDPRNRCRLYHNLGNGRFVDVAALAGVLNERYAKGAVWGDYDDDDRLDLFVSNMGKKPVRLYHNEGNGTFRDVAQEVGIVDKSPGAPLITSFPCLFWDFDNDGRLDLFINEWKANQGEIVAGYCGIHVGTSSPPRLYRNLGPGGFRDVSREVGLDRPIASMSVNCGDIDNDGFLDLYLGTGWMAYSGLVPNVMLKNVDGRRFEDVTDSTRTGHLQKGHGVSFADWDCDGDLDLFTVLGGGYPGDKGYSALFQNPGHGRHWLKVKLIGTKTNRSALGAKVRVDLKGADGATRSINRTIGTNGSFGGNSLVETIGLADAKFVTRLTVYWPTSRTSQSFRDVAADQAIEITEGSDSFKVLHQLPLPLPPPTR
ncbi:MAG: FG-GAP-like repeat-containing protein [Isosphaerales bacterium]